LSVSSFRQTKVVGVFVRFRPPIQLYSKMVLPSILYPNFNGMVTDSTAIF
jgi:hypothetical protein